MADQVTAPQQIPAPGNILDKFRLDGKVVVVTGGARGLGNSMLRAFCQAGAAGAAILDILPLGEEAAKAIEADFKIPAVFHKVDVRDAAKLQEAADAIMAKFGHIDVLLAASGIVQHVKAEDYPAEDFKRMMDINLNGLFFSCQAVGRHMIAQKTGGSIIGIASMSGHIVNHPQPQAGYNASKAAVIHLCKSLAAEWAPHKIRVNTISPGYMETPMNAGFQAQYEHIWFPRTPQARAGQDYELNGAALYLASEASSFATGTDILIDGGYTVW